VGHVEVGDNLSWRQGGGWRQPELEALWVGVKAKVDDNPSWRQGGGWRQPDLEAL